MNIVKIMLPKVCTVFLRADQTVRQGLEVMTRNGYTAIPVLDENQHYIGCISEGDFLRHIMSVNTTDKRELEKTRVRELVRRDFCPALPVDASVEEVTEALLNQNFLPIVDGRNTLCGIVTRKGLIAYLSEQKETD